MMLSRDEILKHTGDTPRREVEVPAWNGSVLLRGMTVREYEINLNSIGKDDGKSSAALVARCALDERGARLFDDSDIDRIAELPLAQMMELTNTISKLSGLLPDDDGEAKDGDEGKAPSDSPSAAPSSEASSETSD